MPDDGTTFYWKVSAENQLGKKYSTPEYFVNGPSAPPSTPILYYPIHGENDYDLDIAFDYWSARAATYYLEIAGDDQFRTLFFGDWVDRESLRYITGFRSDGRTYYWRVAAMNSRGTSAFSNAESFVNGPLDYPETPVMVSPENEAISGSEQVSFRWKDSQYALDYYLEISRDAAFSDLVKSTWIGDNLIYDGNNVGADLDVFLDDGQVYFWRVSAGNPWGTSYYSDPWFFINGPSAPPAVPGLDAPANGSHVGGTSVRFTWFHAARASDYNLRLAKDIGFTNIVFEGLTGNDLAFDINNFANDGQVYYWQVEARNDVGVSRSETGYFINQTAPPTSAPGAPILKSPGSNVIEPGTTITFSWEQNSTDQVDDYYLEISLDPDFSSHFFDQLLGKVLTHSVPNFADDGTTYYWRVTASNVIGAEASSVRSFINGPSDLCSATNGSGIGVLWGAPKLLNTCFAGDAGMYYLKDVTHRASGLMKANAAIITGQFGFGKSKDIMTDTDNVWDYYQAQSSGVDAHYYADKVYRYFADNAKGWSINSFDDCGSTMESIVNVDDCMNQAQWGEAYVQYCIGVGQLPLSGAMDVVAHEWGHALSMYATDRSRKDCATGRPAAPLIRAYESGALSDAFSDWIGVAVKKYYNGDVTWTIGEDIKLERNLSNPPASPTAQPDTYHRQDRYWFPIEGCTPDEQLNDYCGIHTNSGVPNKMFYLLSQGGTHPVTNITVEGIGLEKAMAIAYIANKEEWKSNTTFSEARDGMVRAAQLFGSNEVLQVQNAWAAVGVSTLPVIVVGSLPTNGGTTSGGGSYTWGASVTVSAESSVDYDFVDWTENGIEVSDSPSYTFTVRGSRNLVANFAYKFGYTLTATAEPGGSVTPVEVQHAMYGTKQTFTVIAETGYHISSVSGCGERVK